MHCQSRRPGGLAAIVAAIIVLLPSIALAGHATSGNVFRGTWNIPGHGNTRVCLESSVTTNGTPIVMNGGATRTFDNAGGNCDGPRVLPTGWIGVTLDGYRNGAFCSTTGYRYTGGANSQMMFSQNLCSNPAGIQTFHTNVFGRVWGGAAYINIPGIAGPAQND